MLLLFIYLKDEELISNILWEKSWLYYNISKGMLCSIVNREKVVLSYEFWKKNYYEMLVVKKLKVIWFELL
jgi:hypothetical protein